MRAAASLLSRPRPGAEDAARPSGDYSPAPLHGRVEAGVTGRIKTMWGGLGWAGRGRTPRGLGPAGLGDLMPQGVWQGGPVRENCGRGLG